MDLGITSESFSELLTTTVEGNKKLRFMQQNQSSELNNAQKHLAST